MFQIVQFHEIYAAILRHLTLNDHGCTILYAILNKQKCWRQQLFSIFAKRNMK